MDVLTQKPILSIIPYYDFSIRIPGPDLMKEAKNFLKRIFIQSNTTALMNDSLVFLSCGFRMQQLIIVLPRDPRETYKGFDCFEIENFERGFKNRINAAR